MTQPAPLTEKTAERASDADEAIKCVWARMTRADTAVGVDGRAILHGTRWRFNLWEAVSA